MTCTVYDTPIPPTCEELWWESPVEGYEFSPTSVSNPSGEPAQFM